MLWSRPFYGVNWGGPVAVDATEVVWTWDNAGDLVSLNSSGTLRSVVSTTGAFAPTIDALGTVFAENGATLSAFDSSGTFEWSYPTDGASASAAVDASSGVAYVGTPSGLVAVSPTGTLVWKRPTEDVSECSPAIDSSGTVYIGGENLLYAIASDGHITWTYPADLRLSRVAIGPDGTIYVATDSHLDALRPDGTRLWSYAAPRLEFSTPIIGADGTIYTGSQFGKVLAFNANGTVKWTYQTLGWVTSFAIGADGTVYVDNFEDDLYAFADTGHLIPCTLLAPTVSVASPRHGKTVKFRTRLTPANAAGAADVRLRLYHAETKVVTQTVRGKRRRVKVSYWHLRGDFPMNAGLPGRFSVEVRLREKGRWKTRATYGGWPAYGRATSDEARFVVR